MLRSNCKAAKEAIKAYIMENFDASGYTENVPEKWEDIALFILETFREEKCKYDRRPMSEWQHWEEWCSGLPTILDCCYYYNRSARFDLGEILQESPHEAEKYSEREAETRLTWLMYRELTATERRCRK